MDLLKNFKIYLLIQGYTPISIRNYLSDLNHFLSWLELTLRSRNLPLLTNEFDFIKAYFKKEILFDYKKYLDTNQIPLKTINRRLSTLRTLGKFCLTQGWLSENPAREMSNVKNQKTKLPKEREEKEKILLEFKKSLEQEKTSTGRQTSSNTIKSYLSDIREFLSFLVATT